MKGEFEKYREIFESEAKELIQKSEDILLRIERKGFKKELLDELFRYFHTLKGSSASIGEKEIEKIAHSIEDILEKAKKGSQIIIDIEDIFSRIDRIKNIIDRKKEIEYEIEIFLSPDTILKGPRAFVIMQNIKNFAEIVETEPDTEKIKEGEFEISFKVRIKTHEENLNNIKEIIDSYSEVEYIKIKSFEEKKEKRIEMEKYEIPEIKVKAENVDRIINYMGEILIEKDRLRTLIKKAENKEIKESFENLESMMSLLQDEIVNLRLVPVKIILGMLPRYVRDEAKKLGKKINLEMEGEEIEVDRVILEKIKDPLIHIVRNSIDHGIETPEERKMVGKEETGKIIITVRKDKGTIFISVRDDGRGIDREKVLKKALEIGMIKESEIYHLNEGKITDILTAPSFSTKSRADSLSGRGVGLNAVREILTKLGGDMKIQSKEGEGTEVVLRIPISLSIIKALIVKGGRSKYVLPLNYVQGIYNIKNVKIYTLHHKKFMVLSKKIYPVFNFNEILGLTNGEVKEAVVIEGENKNFVILCEKVISQQDIFVKNLDEILMKVSYVTGGTILEDGKPYLIVDPMIMIAKGEK